jgi:hypothetical protein
LKSTLAHVSLRSPLKASLNFLALSLVTGPTGTSNGSFDGWIASRFQQKGWQFSKFLVRRKHSRRNKRILLQHGNNMGLLVDPHHTCSCLKEKNTNTKS